MYRYCMARYGSVALIQIWSKIGDFLMSTKS
jgi:hypothetical protein